MGGLSLKNRQFVLRAPVTIIFVAFDRSRNVVDLGKKSYQKIRSEHDFRAIFVGDPRFLDIFHCFSIVKYKGNQWKLSTLKRLLEPPSQKLL